MTLDSILVEDSKGMVPDGDLEIVIPTLNEEKNVPLTIGSCLLYTKNIIVVDGQSEDKTREIAGSMGARVIVQKGRGKGNALREAFAHLNGGLVVVIIDADGSMRPEEIPNFVEAIRKGADVVKGSRFLPSGGSYDISFIRRIGNTGFRFLFNRILGTSFTDLCYGYLAFNRNVLEKLGPQLTSNGFDIEVEIVAKAAKMGLNIVEVPSLELRRVYGVSRLRTIRDGAHIFVTIMKAFVWSYFWLIYGGYILHKIP